MPRQWRQQQTHSDRANNQILRINEGTVQWDQFEDAVQQAVYNENAFPSLEQARVSAMEIVVHIKGLQSEEETIPLYEIDNHMINKVSLLHHRDGSWHFFRFNSITSAKRTNLHSGIDMFLSKYDFHKPDLGEGVSLETREERFAYLIKSNKFVESGHFIQKD